MASPISSAFAQTGDRIYEMRMYSTHPGKLSNALQRLDRAAPLFIKHGMKVIAFWMPESDKNLITYLLSHDNREAARASWQGFHSDPKWRKLYRVSRLRLFIKRYRQ